MPTPTAQLAAEGSWRAKERVKSGEPAPPVGDPEIVARLRHSTVGGIYTRLETLLQRTPGLVTVLDGQALQRLAHAYFEHRKAFETLEEFRADNGSAFYVNGAGTVVEHAASKALRQWGETIARLEARFGMTPADRASMRIEAPAEDALGEFSGPPTLKINDEEVA
jgi:hypothetical protein